MTNHDGSHVDRVGLARWLAGAAGLGAVGTIAGVTAARSMTRRAAIDDPYVNENFETLDGDRSYVVTTPDGVPLAVREVGPADAPLTVVFAHGFCLRMGAFHFQRMRLSDEWGPQVRMIFYDQRGHGQSGDAPPETYTLTQLGMDLETVLQVIAPRGPVVLVGHSMGGMTVLSHARQYPHHYGSRIVGAALISSAAEGVAKSPLGEILNNPALEAVRRAARSAPKLVATRSQRGPLGDRADPAGRVLRRPERQPEHRGVLREDDARHPDPDADGVLARLGSTRRDGGTADAGDDPDTGRLRRPRLGHPRRVLEEDGRRTAGV